MDYNCVRALYLLKGIERAGEIAERLRALTVLTENQIQFPAPTLSHPRLTTTSNSSFKGWRNLIPSSGLHDLLCTCILVYTHTHWVGGKYK